MAAISAMPSTFIKGVKSDIDEDMHTLETLFFRALDGEGSTYLSAFIEDRCRYSHIQHKKVFTFFSIALLFSAETDAWKTALKIVLLSPTKAFSKGNFLRVFTLAIDSNQQEFLKAVRFFHPKLLNKDQKHKLSSILKESPTLDPFLTDV
jgi:hypothetical protein